ncbi:MAG: YidC/Oxa1 family insertase periplasmic-domain containing protein [Phycisphaerae bacterium]|nr:YidC/Oxa1 family insertase periplasmic-domain containing protein [Phycisphaerae bacterium]
MKTKIAVIVGLSVFCIFCAVLITDAMFHHPQQTKNMLRRVVPLASEADTGTEAAPPEMTEPDAIAVTQKTAETITYPQLSATSAKLQTVALGKVYGQIKRTDDPDKYKFLIELTTKGAAVRQVILNEFKARDQTNNVEVLSAGASKETVAAFPLTLLSPLSNGREIYSLANTNLRVAPAQAESFGKKSFPLDKLSWELVKTPSADEIRFEAVLKDADTGAKMLKVIKTYRVQPGSYDLHCEIAVENLSDKPFKVQMQMQGPGGISREGVRQDARRIKLAYRSGETGVEAVQLDAASMAKKIEKNNTEAFLLKSKKNDLQLWSALTNMYFTAIVRPIPIEGQAQPWLQFNQAQYYPSATDDKDDQNCSYTMTSQAITLDPAGSDGATQSYSLAMYLGPKDKRIFEKNDIYKSLQYFQTIDFRACCCPVSIIAPLAFGVMWLMNTMYTLMGPLGNYGVVIIILVFFVRLAMHPITKKSQISMMKMQKLGPKMKEIQAKYANNKQEMNKQVMAMYREQGVSPVSGMLPMFLQMPIWIALWTAVYTSVDLRGASFLPFWITDLSMPDQLFTIPYVAKLQALKYIGHFIPTYFNLLPILMGVVMYLQQKMMPSQAAAQPDSQMAQQQKMMMIMMPLMFPIMLYSGPSGVNLYIMTSIGAGVIEQKVIRKHLQEKEEAEAVGKVPVTSKTGGKVKKKKPKPMFKG